MLVFRMELSYIFKCHLEVLNMDKVVFSAYIIFFSMSLNAVIILAYYLQLQDMNYMKS
jgi:hypothetical protein